MRRIVWLLVLLAALWCAWWAGASFIASKAAAAWFDMRRAEGWLAEHADSRTSGFPDQIELTLQDVELADPHTGLAVGLDALTMSARAIWPGDLTVTLPDTPIRIATPDARWQLLAQDGQAMLNLHPGASGTLENLSLHSGPFHISTGDGTSVMGGAALQLALAQTDQPQRYTVTLDVTDFAPGATVRDALSLHPDWPPLFDTLLADLNVRFDRPIDRRALEDRRPQPVELAINRVEAKWGDMRFLATGNLIADSMQNAEGSVTIKAENWLKMVDLAENAGLLSPDYRPQVESVLSSLAAGTGQTSDLDVTLRFENGRTKIGFIPLGPAPRLVIR